MYLNNISSNLTFKNVSVNNAHSNLLSVNNALISSPSKIQFAQNNSELAQKQTTQANKSDSSLSLIALLFLLASFGIMAYRGKLPSKSGAKDAEKTSTQKFNDSFDRFKTFSKEKLENLKKEIKEVGLKLKKFFSEKFSSNKSK
jgi:hypothetical protein